MVWVTTRLMAIIMFALIDMLMVMLMVVFMVRVTWSVGAFGVGATLV